MGAIQPDVFRSSVVALRQVNHRAVLVTTLYEVVDQGLLIFLANDDLLLDDLLIINRKFTQHENANLSERNGSVKLA